MMPRVVPSQIVDFIGRIIDNGLARHMPGSSPALSFNQKTAIASTIGLLSELPSEFLLLSGEQYSDYILSVNNLKELVEYWSKDGPKIVSLQADQGTKALYVIRDLLKTCPDEFPFPNTVELSFITDATDLRDDIRNDVSSANRALHDGLWKAATVLAGAASEALLLWAITERKSASDIETAREAVIPTASKDTNRWVLNEYIKVATHVGLVDIETGKQVDLAREFRDLIHPGRSARLAKVCDRGTALSALAAVELIVRDLSGRIGQSRTAE
jgi:hypothetical protein